MVDSGGRVTSLSVVSLGWHNHLVPQRWETGVGLANPEINTANFAVLTPIESVTWHSAVATSGYPARVYRYEAYTILVWRKDLLPLLDAPPPRPRTHPRQLTRQAHPSHPDRGRYPGERAAESLSSRGPLLLAFHTG